MNTEINLKLDEIERDLNTLKKGKWPLWLFFNKVEDIKLKLDTLNRGITKC